jgi:hypothetical protein
MLLRKQEGEGEGGEISESLGDIFSSSNHMLERGVGRERMPMHVVPFSLSAVHVRTDPDPVQCSRTVVCTPHTGRKVVSLWCTP